ncbi:Myb-like DNA-binding domain containing protein [Tritrichomonas foetus]|uniref:Myb-like DNA-binding domain containing protein n=1 Tax=Tritrichomonas foetus TaxID=1144522 RepID=A0A1J4JEL5_9EUKA|nr:Myb-like DNA-binding domain containing protein [Tritrichomonas foetus]|eukprot:OHS97552.1 Myb-like DNA-binding domain containing protein [Tritrichomonas foetus]
MTKNPWAINLDSETTNIDDEHLSKVCACRRRVFSTEEDKILADLVQSQQCTNWFEIAQKMPGRTARQCRDRWINYLSPTNSFAPWSQEEDELIIEKVNELGTSWSSISKFVEGRSDNTLKNRWYSGLKKNCFIDENGKYVLKNSKNEGKGIPRAKIYQIRANKRKLHPKRAARKTESQSKETPQSEIPEIETHQSSSYKSSSYFEHNVLTELQQDFFYAIPQILFGSPAQPIIIPPNPYLQSQNSNSSSNSAIVSNSNFVAPLYAQSAADSTQDSSADSTNGESFDNDFWDRHLFHQIREMSQDPFNVTDLYGEWF